MGQLLSKIPDSTIDSVINFIKKKCPCFFAPQNDDERSDIELDSESGPQVNEIEDLESQDYYAIKERYRLVSKVILCTRLGTDYRISVKGLAFCKINTKDLGSR